MRREAGLALPRFHRWRNQGPERRGGYVKPEVTNLVSGRAQPGAQLAATIRPPDHLPLPQEAAAAQRVERGLRSRTVLGSMLGAPTYQLRDLGQVASSLCPSLLARETRTQGPPWRAPVEPEGSALPWRGVGGVRALPQRPPGPGMPGDRGHGRQHQLPPPSRGPPRRHHPYMAPQAPRRSLPRSVSGPGGRAPPAASSSGGHRVRHLPSSPRIAAQTPTAAQSSARKDVAPVSPRAPGRRAPRPLLPGSCARGDGAGPGRGQRARGLRLG